MTNIDAIGYAIGGFAVGYMAVGVLRDTLIMSFKCGYYERRLKNISNNYSDAEWKHIQAVIDVRTYGDIRRLSNDK